MTTKHDLGELGYGFVSAEFLPHGADEYHLREQQSPDRGYRALTADEIARLKANANFSGNWADVLVCDGFDTDLVQGSRFYGRVRIGRLQRHYLTFHDLKVPVGIYDSTVISGDLGDNVSIMKVGYLSHYIVGNETIIAQVDEIACTNHSKFGSGTIKDGETEEVRIQLELGNENGGRGVLPFDGMSSADAFLWYKYRGNKPLMQRFREMTDSLVDPARGYYGTIGRGVVIKSCRVIKDTRVGDAAYIKGANKLKNLTINSSEAEPTQIGEGVELVNGIIEPGCRIFYGVKAVRFYLAAHASLKYGARLINSFLGENSTISCCEVLNSLIFPFHEQHHNNSFLCAALVCGQSNMAAGATLGSNHNSRANDGELVAGRGFWPGLCVSIKHSSRFASFTLLAKADYPAELNVPLPFSLVSREEGTGNLVIVPAYWFHYNMYALARNAWKSIARDRRSQKTLRLETDYLAPDTAEEMLDALRFLDEHAPSPGTEQQAGDDPPRLLPAGLIERSRRPVVLRNARRASRTYREALVLYAVRALVEWLEDEGVDVESGAVSRLRATFSDAVRTSWVNVGGQLVPQPTVEQMIDDVCSGSIASWADLHARYAALARDYPAHRAAHAAAVLAALGNPVHTMNDEAWRSLVGQAVETAQRFAAAVRESRAKDYADPFRAMTFDSTEEMEQVLGTVDDNEFIRHAEEEALRFAERAGRWQ